MAKFRYVVYVKNEIPDEADLIADAGTISTKDIQEAQKEIAEKYFDAHEQSKPIYIDIEEKKEK